MASGWTRVNIIVALQSIRGGNLELGTKVRNSSFWCVSDGPPPDRFQPPAATREVCDMVRQQRLNHRRLPLPQCRAVTKSNYFSPASPRNSERYSVGVSPRLPPRDWDFHYWLDKPDLIGLQDFGNLSAKLRARLASTTNDLR